MKNTENESKLRNIIVIFMVYLSCQFSAVQGIRCWTCENAISNDDCILRGGSVNCYSDGMGCSSEVRYHAGFVFKIQIKKGCKQILACGSDKSQNGHGWYPVQCNPKYPDSICRCCCQTRDCNKNLVGCEPPQPDCRELSDPENGYKICNNEDYPTALRSVCTFYCKKGYEMKGDRVTQCVLQKPGKAIWSYSEPRCYNKRCKPLYKNTASRKVQCTDKNNAGSECSFTCAEGHTMNGEPKSTCLYSKNWDYPPPDCVKIKCPPAIIPPQHGSKVCSEGAEYGSICRYMCDPGYTLVGNGTRQCVLSSTPYSAFGEWSGALPQCIAIKCLPKQLNPSSGTVDCTDMNYIGSNCKYQCKNDYVLEGINSNTCILNKTSGEGRWTSEPPVCTPTRCPDLEYNTTYGRIICSNKNNVGSMCALSCNAGSHIRAPSSPGTIRYNWIVSCLYGGFWSQEPAECAPITCSPDVSADKLSNGVVLCSDKNNYQSECIFSCNEGFELIGKKRITCRSAAGIGSSGEWDGSPPTCKIIGCPALPKSGRTMKVSCTKRYEEGSSCTFVCRGGGYFMTLQDSIPHTQGKHTIECLEGNVWDGPIAKCLELRCLTTFGPTPNGITKCSNGNKFKSRCTFSCNVAYGLEGRPVSICSENALSYGEGIWTSTQPACIRNGCAPKFASPTNGKMSCTNKNLFNSACTFSCRAGSYMKSHDNYLIESNSLTIRCSTEGDWSQIPPTCHPITCKPRTNIVLNGNFTCSNENMYKSRCKYTCDEGYEVSADTDTTVCTDKLTSSAFGLWSHENIKCRRATCKIRQRAPNGGMVGCTAGDGVGSACLFECYKGFYLNATGKIIRENKFEVKCLKSKKWSATFPQCLPITCPARTIANGDASCTNENIYMSTCRYYCLPGYQLSGKNSSKCLPPGGKAKPYLGKWSNKPPTCKELQCNRRTIAAPKNGFVLCSDGSKLRSTCEFICDVGFSLRGEQYIICQQEGDSLEWDNPPPRCVKSPK